MKQNKWRALKKSLREKTVRGLKWLLIIGAAVHVGQIALFKWVCPPLTVTQWSAVLEGHTFLQRTATLDDISPHLQLAVIASEDQLFAQHNGFDFESIKKAMAHNRSGKSLRGASTISQQTAKNVFLWQQRSWFRKGMEMYYTFLMETLYGKKRILELYLNVAEMGPGIFGAEAAAHAYFDKSAAALSKTEAALLAACLPNPKKTNPGNPSPHTKRKAQWILSQMNYLKTRPGIKRLLTRN